jgi:hypothetical protein
VPHGTRTKEEAAPLVQTIQSHRDGAAPLCLREGGQPYPEGLETTSRHDAPGPSSGRGRPRHPRRVVEETRKEAPGIPQTPPGRLVAGAPRLFRGPEEELWAMIRAEPRGQTIKTSEGESRQGNDRQDNTRLTRRRACHATKVPLPEAQMA